MRILFLCTGNICRSPAAEYLLRARLAELGTAGVEVESAGFMRMEGYPACNIAAATAGVDMSPHKARLVTRPMIESADMILAMEKRHRTLAMELAPAAKGKIGLFAGYLKGREEMDIPDPYGGTDEEYRKAMALVKEGVAALAEELARGGRKI